MSKEFKVTYCRYSKRIESEVKIRAPNGAVTWIDTKHGSTLGLDGVE